MPGRSEGDFLYVPPGGIHAFSNESGAPARMLILFAPAPPREEYFRELAGIRSSGRPMTDEDWLEVWARHDQYPVSPSGGQGGLDQPAAAGRRPGQ